MDDMVSDIFDTCLAQIAVGATVEDCLVAYPAQRGALEPLLRMATRLQRLPQPAPLPLAVQAVLTTRVLTHVSSASALTTNPLRPAPALPAVASSPAPSALLAGVLRTLGYRGSLTQPGLRIGLAALACVLALVLAGSVYAAVRAIGSTSPAASAALQEANRFGLAGIIEEMNTVTLMVEGITVDIGPQTIITGTPAVGTRVGVRGLISDAGALLAESIIVDASAAAPVQASTAGSGDPIAVTSAALPSAAPAQDPALPAPSAAPVLTAPPVPASDPLVQLRQLLEAGQADGRAGDEGQEFLNKLSEAEYAFAEGNGQKAGDQLRDLYQKLAEKAREGKINLSFAQEAQTLIAIVGEVYQVQTVSDNEEEKEKEEKEKEEKEKDE